MTANKSMERRLRHALNKRDLLLRKSRVQNIHADNLGGYMIVAKFGGYVVAGDRFEMSLDDVEAWMKD